MSSAPEDLPSPSNEAAIVGPDGVALDDPAELFHEASKNYQSFALPVERPYLYSAWQLGKADGVLERGVKRYPQARSIPLGQPTELAMPLGAALRRRRSRRVFSGEPISSVALSTVLAASYGPAQAEGASPARVRTTPSGGALYPLELYLFVGRVDAIEPGIYHYDPVAHGLEQLAATPAGSALRAAVIDDGVLEGHAVVFVFAAMFWRSRFKYGLRGYRYALIEAGHAAQNLLLAAEAVRLRAYPFGGFYDAKVEQLLDLDGVNESVLSLVICGHG